VARCLAGFVEVRVYRGGIIFAPVISVNLIWVDLRAACPLLILSFIGRARTCTRP
jgi:hypothetical protein